MTILDTDDIGDRHQYLADKRPDWRRSMASIRSEGGPWWCQACGSGSLLIYRCSICGRDLVAAGKTHGGQG
jgi:hypothetical protein